MRLAILADLPNGTIVRHKGWWAVVERGGGSRWRTLHYWWAPRRRVPSTTQVEVPARQGL